MQITLEIEGVDLDLLHQAITDEIRLVSRQLLPSHSKVRPIPPETQATIKRLEAVRDQITQYIVGKDTPR